MKIRTDYVSNSSSSSFVIFGQKMDVSQFDIEAFSHLGQNEAYLLVLPNRGCEGDYIINLTPELIMDFDMHQFDLTKGNLPIIKARYYISEGGYLHKASDFKDEDCYGWSNDDDEDDYVESFNKKSRLEGVVLPSDCKMFRFDKDYGNPSERSSILEEVESALRFG